MDSWNYVSLKKLYLVFDKKKTFSVHKYARNTLGKRKVKRYNIQTGFWSIQQGLSLQAASC